MNGAIVLVEGYCVDNRPKDWLHCLVDCRNYGHVAWVSNVIGDEIEIEEYNYGIRNLTISALFKANTMTGFIHFKDLAWWQCWE